MLSERLGTFPDVPTFAEQGYGIANPAIRMLVGPKGLPDSVVDVLVENLKQGYDGEIRDSVSGIDEEPALLTGPELDLMNEKMGIVTSRDQRRSEER